MSFPYPLPLLLDGATSTELQKLGMPLNTCSETWLLEHPEAIVQIQRDYIRAGSRIVYAPTFGANRAALARHRVDIPIPELCDSLVAMSHAAVAGTDALIGGDMSPTGLQLEPFGTSSFEDLASIFREQAQALEDAGVDLFAVETQICLEEARAAVTAIRQVSAKPIFVTFSCGPTGRSLWGDDLAEASAQMEDLGVDAYGVNCCGDLALLTGLVRSIRSRCSLPIIVKPNAGLPVMADGRPVYNMSPEDLAAHVPALREAGAALFGGCCGTHAGHIAAMGAALKAL